MTALRLLELQVQSHVELQLGLPGTAIEDRELRLDAIASNYKTQLVHLEHRPSGLLKILQAERRLSGLG